MRFYSPTIGQFISRDPIAEQGGENVYQYADGDPVNKTDPTGLSAKSDARKYSVRNARAPRFGQPGTWSYRFGENLQAGETELTFYPDEPVSPLDDLLLGVAFQIAMADGKLTADEITTLPLTHGQANAILEKASITPSTPQWEFWRLTADTQWANARLNYPGVPDTHIPWLEAEQSNIIQAKKQIAIQNSPAFRAYCAVLPLFANVAGVIPFLGAAPAGAVAAQPSMATSSPWHK